MTMSVLHLTLATFATLLPQIIITLFAGVFSDMLNRRLILITSNVLQLLSTIVLIFLLTLGISAYGFIITVLIFRSILQTFYQPTFFAIVPSMIPQKHLGRINGFIYFLIYLMQILGPLCASRLMLIYPPEQILWIEVIAIGNALIPLLLLKIPMVKEETQMSEDRMKDYFVVSYFKQIWEGIKTVILSLGIIIFFVMIFVLEYLSRIFWTVQIYLIEVIHGGSVIVASLFPIFLFLGVFIGSNIFVIRKYWNPVILFFVISILLVFLGDLVVILAPYQSFGLIFFTQIVKGFSLVFVYSMIPTVIQSTVPKNKMGRVSSIYITLTSLASFLGTFHLSLFYSVIPDVELLLLITSIFGIASTIVFYLVIRIIKLKSINYKILDSDNST